MSTYIAWDGNEYPLPTPEGWYLGSDDRWWPDGHGPGPAAAAPPPPAAAAPPPPASSLGSPSAPPPMGMPSAAPPMGSSDTVYSAPPAASGSFDPDAFAGSSDDGSGGNGKRALILGGILAGLIAVGAGAWFALGSDDDEAAPATSVAPTQLDDDADTTTTTTGGDDTGDETTDTTAAAVADGKGTVDDPYAIGDTIEIRYDDFESGEERVWNVVVLEPLSNITDAVAAENQFNDPPPPDTQFMGAPIRVTYVSGPSPATLFELSFKAVGPSGVVVATFDPSCGVIPNALDTFAELFEGGTVEGNVCWTVGPQDQSDLTMIVEVFFSDEAVYADLTG